MEESISPHLATHVCGMSFFFSAFPGVKNARRVLSELGKVRLWNDDTHVIAENVDPNSLGWIKLCKGPVSGECEIYSPSGVLWARFSLHEITIWKKR